MFHTPMPGDEDFNPDTFGHRNRRAELDTLRTTAREILTDPHTIILDTETTGLRGNDRIVEFAAITTAGETLADFRVNPQVPIGTKARSIHKISDADIAGAPTWAEKFPPLWAEWQSRDVRRVVIYNASFDIRLIRQSSRPDPTAYAAFEEFRETEFYCAMLAYSAWRGDWQEWSGDYRWQKLPGGDHTALGDCHATLSALHRIAEGTPTP